MSQFLNNGFAFSIHQPVNVIIIFSPGAGCASYYGSQLKTFQGSRVSFFLPFSYYFIIFPILGTFSRAVNINQEDITLK